MPTAPRSPFTHGRSEIWTRPTLTRAIRREQQRLGARLRELRIGRGISMAMAAELGGIYDGHLGRIERGEINVTVAVLVALAKAYRVPLAEFFRDDVVLNPRAVVPRATTKKAPRAKPAKPAKRVLNPRALKKRRSS